MNAALHGRPSRGYKRYANEREMGASCSQAILFLFFSSASPVSKHEFISRPPPLRVFLLLLLLLLLLLSSLSPLSYYFFFLGFYPFDLLLGVADGRKIKLGERVQKKKDKQNKVKCRESTRRFSARPSNRLFRFLHMRWAAKTRYRPNQILINVYQSKNQSRDP